MTHVDMGVKQTAAEFLFVLCKESGERNQMVICWRQTLPGKKRHFCVLVLLGSLTCCVLMALCFSWQSAEVHRLWERSRAPRGSRTSFRGKRGDSIFWWWRLRHRRIQKRQTFVSTGFVFNFSRVYVGILKHLLTADNLHAAYATVSLIYSDQGYHTQNYSVLYKPLLLLGNTFEKYIITLVFL